MNSSKHIVFLPGIWSPTFFLHSLANKMKKKGYHTSFVSYNSVRDQPNKVITKVHQHLLKHPGCHIVGHSMGGLLAVNTLNIHQDIDMGHVVCLGSPLQGSKVAGKLAQFAPGKMYLGQSQVWLTQSHFIQHGKVGVIAGNQSKGLGKFFIELDGENDGTVEVKETYTEGLEDHALLDASHTGLLWHPQCSVYIHNFLNQGRF